MIASAHIAVGFASGLLIAEKIKDPYLASVVAFGSGIVLHYLTDIIPHGHIVDNDKLYEPKSRLIIFLDLIAGSVIFSILTYINFKISLQSFVIAFSILGNLLPDILASQFYYPGKIPPKKGILHLEYKIHWGVHWHGTDEKSLKWGIRDIWQISLIIISIYLGFKLG